MLSNKYFWLLDNDKMGEYNITLYQPKGYSLVLRSKKNNRDLCVIYINDIYNKDKKPIISKYSNEYSDNKYQIILNEKKTNISFVITNLCYEGYIKCYLMQNKLDIKQHINKNINIAPLKSYEFNNDNTKNKIISISKKENIVYENVLYLMVTPYNNILELNKYFKETYWTIVDNIIVFSYNFINTTNNKQQTKIIDDKSKPLGLDKIDIEIISVKQHIKMIEEKCIYNPLYNNKEYKYTYNPLCDNKNSTICVFGITIINNININRPILFKRDNIKYILKEYKERYKRNIFEKIKINKEEKCVICLEEKVNIIFICCGHICTCSIECAKPLKKCPICKIKIKDIIEKEEITKNLSNGIY